MLLTDVQPARAKYWQFTEAVKGVGSCLPAMGKHEQEVFYFEGNDLSRNYPLIDWNEEP